MPSIISHVRKRDRRLVPFEPEKIIRSIDSAAQSCGHNDDFFSREIADAVVLHLEKKHSLEHPSTNDIASSINIVLISLNHDNVASAIQSFQFERENSRLRCTVWKPSQPSLFNAGFGLQVTVNNGQRTTAWDRTRIIRALEKEARISRKVAENIARTVEQKIMSSDLNRVTTTLIRAITDNELLIRGYASALRQMSSVTVPFTAMVCETKPLVIKGMIKSNTTVLLCFLIIANDLTYSVNYFLKILVCPVYMSMVTSYVADISVQMFQ